MNGMDQYIQNLALNQFQKYKSIIDKQSIKDGMPEERVQGVTALKRVVEGQGEVCMLTSNQTH